MREGENTKCNKFKESIKFKFSKKTSLFIGYGIVYLLIILLGLAGVFLFQTSPNQTLYGFDYSEQCNNRQTCSTTFYISQNITSAIYIYYSISNFISSTKDYLLSKSYNQLQGFSISATEANKCYPYSTNGQMNVSKSYKGYNLKSTDIASPCGLQAKLFFNDTFSILNSSSYITINRVLNLSYFSLGPNSTSTQWINPTSDDFQIWMTTSVGSTINKYYGVINSGLSKGNYTLKINNVMDYSNYSNNYIKTIYLRTINNSYGDDAQLLSYYSIGGSISLFLLSLIQCLCFDLQTLKQ